MLPAPRPPLQLGLPEFVPDLIGVAGALVLVLMLAALAGIAYRALTGGIEWPEDRAEEDEAVRQGTEDEEWDYY